jgi:hypothetical protein
MVLRSHLVGHLGISLVMTLNHRSPINVIQPSLLQPAMSTQSTTKSMSPTKDKRRLLTRIDEEA